MKEMCKKNRGSQGSQGMKIKLGLKIGVRTPILSGYEFYIGVRVVPDVERVESRLSDE